MLGQPINRTLTDSELQSVILQLQSNMPALGQTIVWGGIRSMGFSITRERVRNALCAIHPIDTALRWRGQQVHHQPYCVPGPNSLWHLGKEYDLMQYSITLSSMTFYRWSPRVNQIGDGDPLCNRWI